MATYKIKSGVDTKNSTVYLNLKPCCKDMFPDIPSKMIIKLSEATQKQINIMGALGHPFVEEVQKTK